MPAKLDHTIVHSRDADATARFLSEILGLPPPTRFGPFLVVEADNGVSLDVMDVDGTWPVEHYAFLVDEDEFDRIFGRLEARGIRYFADPFERLEGRINRNDGGRGVYFREPNGHSLEILTRRYGSGAR